MSKERVIAYIDGFNLYFGMKQSGNNKLLWLDVLTLVKSIIKAPQALERTYYFTSRISNNPGKQKRQNTYIEALETLEGVEIVYGQYNYHDVTCNVCSTTHAAASEKMTDVNIACQMLSDAYKDNYDTAFLITGDSDLVPPVNMIHDLFPKKRVVVIFPPNRHTNKLAKAAKGSLMLGKKKILDAQFSDVVQKENGFELKRPETWI